MTARGWITFIVIGITCPFTAGWTGVWLGMRYHRAVHAEHVEPIHHYLIAGTRCEGLTWRFSLQRAD
jgi:hypothetical protein